MKVFRSLLCPGLVSLLALILIAPASAGTIFLSGDTNIINPVSGSAPPEPENPGNQQFFENILQGGSSVLIQQGTRVDVIRNADAELNDFYNGLGRVGSNLLAGDITGADLAGVDLFISILPFSRYSPIETAALSTFLGGGGSVFFLGEHRGLALENDFINAALSALGSGMLLSNDSCCAGFQNADILSDPFTAGINPFRFAFPSSVSGGTPLFLAQESPFIAYETIQTPIPELTTLFLVGLGLVGLALHRKRRR